MNTREDPFVGPKCVSGVEWLTSWSEVHAARSMGDVSANRDERMQLVARGISEEAEREIETEQRGQESHFAKETGREIL